MTSPLALVTGGGFIGSNLVDALEDRVAGRVDNVGCGERISVNRLWRETRGLTGAKVEAEHGPARPGDVRDSLASLERASADLGYEVHTPLAEGLRDTVEWLRSDRATS